ncbi:hypothetical protein [Pseudonocardia sp. T1-2H]|uniref:hypothetical protein n=1 Tax=Pseudonocardia sp. T1-2H TaxID=3128899 RepID=UPI0031012F28
MTATIHARAVPSIDTFLDALDALDDARSAADAANQAVARVACTREWAAYYRDQVIRMVSPNGRVDTDRAWMVAILDRLIAAADGVTDPRKLQLSGLIALQPPAPDPDVAPLPEPDQYQLAV